MFKFFYFKVERWWGVGISSNGPVNLGHIAIERGVPGDYNLNPVDISDSPKFKQ